MFTSARRRLSLLELRAFTAAPSVRVYARRPSYRSSLTHSTPPFKYGSELSFRVGPGLYLPVGES